MINSIPRIKGGTTEKVTKGWEACYVVLWLQYTLMPTAAQKHIIRCFDDTAETALIPIANILLKAVRHKSAEGS